MEDGWTIVGDGVLPVELRCAIGDVALAFAAVDYVVSIALCLKGSSEVATVLTPEVFLCDLGRKLKKIGNEYPALKDKAVRIEELSRERNDLMHGCVWEFVWSASKSASRYSVHNYGRATSRDLSVNVLNALAREASQFVNEVFDAISN